MVSKKRIASLLSWKKNDPEAYHRYAREWRKKNKARIADVQRRYWKERRYACLVILSGGVQPHCVRCGYSEVMALQIDHVEHCGVKGRGKLHQLYLAIIKAFMEAREDFLIQFQVLCANCNTIKKCEEREFGGRRSHRHLIAPEDLVDVEVMEYDDPYIQGMLQVRKERDQMGKNETTAVYMPGILGVEYRTKVLPE